MTAYGIPPRDVHDRLPAREGHLVAARSRAGRRAGASDQNTVPPSVGAASNPHAITTGPTAADMSAVVSRAPAAFAKLGGRSGRSTGNAVGRRAPSVLTPAENGFTGYRRQIEEYGLAQWRRWFDLGGRRRNRTYEEIILDVPAIRVTKGNRPSLMARGCAEHTEQEAPVGPEPAGAISPVGRTT